MADDSKTEAQNQSAKGGGGSGMLPALLVIVLMPVISFAMFKFLFIPMIKAEIPEAGQPHAISAEDVVVEHDGGAASYSADFDNVVTNVKGTSQTRFVQVSFTVSGVNPLLPEEVERSRKKMLDVAISVLDNLTLADLERREIKNVVRNQLKQGFDHVMAKPMVDEIYFTQFVVQ